MLNGILIQKEAPNTVDEYVHLDNYYQQIPHFNQKEKDMYDWAEKLQETE